MCSCRPRVAQIWQKMKVAPIFVLPDHYTMLSILPHPIPEYCISWGQINVRYWIMPLLRFTEASVALSLFVQLCFPWTMIVWSLLILQIHHEFGPVLFSKSPHFSSFKTKDAHPFHLLEDIAQNLSIELGLVVTSYEWPRPQLVAVLAASSLGKSDSLYRRKCLYSVFLVGSLALWISTSLLNHSPEMALRKG